jgi:dTDP-4-dehydrorhamnose reductase
MKSDLPVVWITGAAGLIGHYLVETSYSCCPERAVLPLTRHNLDLTDFSRVRATFWKHPPTLVVHCAALSRSPDCQANPELAEKLNVEVTRVLADLAADIPFIFLSTDLVFDGAKGNYREDDAVNPLSVYAETKVKAEQVVLSNPRHLVIRTSLNCGRSFAGNRGFNEQWRAAWREGQMLSLFTDEFRSPIPAEVTARTIWSLAAGTAGGLSGLFHVAGSDRLSRYEMGELLADRCQELNPRFKRASLNDYAGAPRPPDTSFDCRKVQAILPFPLPGLREWVKTHPNSDY